ncbi:hypothetical protein YC2023_085465 [Brassica napus]
MNPSTKPTTQYATTVPLTEAIVIITSKEIFFTQQFLASGASLCQSRSSLHASTKSQSLGYGDLSRSLPVESSIFVFVEILVDESCTYSHGLAPDLFLNESNHSTNK